jgi:hypothetical protein
VAKQPKTKRELAALIADRLRLEGAPGDGMTINITPDPAYGWRVVVMGNPARLTGAQSHADRIAHALREGFYLVD